MPAQRFGGSIPLDKACRPEVLLAWAVNGRPLPPDFLGGGENVRAKEYMTISQVPEQFLSAMVLDGSLLAAAAGVVTHAGGELV